MIPEHEECPVAVSLHAAVHLKLFDFLRLEIVIEVEAASDRVRQRKYRRRQQQLFGWELIRGGEVFEQSVLLEPAYGQDYQCEEVRAREEHMSAATHERVR